MTRLLERLLAVPSEALRADPPIESFAAWLERRPAPAPGASIDAAIEGGFAADRVAWAFASGYQAALGALLPSPSGGELVALAITEEGGGHPSSIRARLAPAGEGFRLTGQKRWATMAPHAKRLVVAASAGTATDGRNLLRLASIDAARSGVAIRPMPPAPFAPELLHAEIDLADVAVAPDELLPGDGYIAFIKPFRTVEDLHVHAALLGYLLRSARQFAWPAPRQEEIVALLVASRALSAEPPLAPSTHIALAGLLGLVRRLVEELEPHWSSADPVVAQRWQRDRPLLEVAGRARAQRRDAAWRSLRGG
jgi:acyl-CoA dehydrogenase